MNALEARLSAPSNRARVASGIAVAVVLALAWLAAEQASRRSVETAIKAFAPAAQHVVLPSVLVIGRRAG